MAKLPAGAALAAMNRPQTLELPSYAKNNPEGFLYPGTYDVPKNATAYTILQLMTAQFAKTSASLKLPETAARKELDPYQAVIVASIIGAETNRPEDYAQGRPGHLQPAAGRARSCRWTRRSTTSSAATVASSPRTSSARTQSPYNTYKYEGLPPTPINSPDRDTCGRR